MTTQRSSIDAKRIMDIMVAGVGLVVLSPLMLVIGWRVRRDLGRPVLFRQVRPGKDGEPFVMIKFRTMRDATDADGRPLLDADRLTDFGHRLRRTSLDELPELWNVLRGEMSLVGPRPLLTEYLEHYTPEQMRRHEVRPGITGLAQVNGRQDIPFSKRLELDVYYIDHWSQLMDTRILFQTATNVLKRIGVRPGQEVKEIDDLGLSTNRKEEVG